MSKHEWTDSQKKAIYCRGNTLISAAAGSGKTATLTEKVVSLLKEDETLSLSDFLIVTFTDAAAKELKEKITKEITEIVVKDSSKSRLLSEVPSADIGTIHGLCSKLLRADFAEADISPDFRIASEDESSSLAKKSVSELLAGGGNPPLGKEEIKYVLDLFTPGKDAAGADESVIGLYNKMRGLGETPEFFERQAEKLESCKTDDFFASETASELFSFLIRFSSHYLNVFRTLKDELISSEGKDHKYIPFADSLISDLEKILTLSEEKRFSCLKKIIEKTEFPKLPPIRSENQTDETEMFHSMRDEYKKDIGKLKNGDFALTDADIEGTLSETAKGLRITAKVLSLFGNSFTKAKRERNLLDFSDLENCALRLLETEDGTPSETALRAGRKYRFIFVDEYQDTNHLQDRIFRALSSGSELFFVGDIKQSIYRFRGAEPDVFTGYRRKWRAEGADLSDKNTSKSIFMSENFRCSESIVDFVNAVSDTVFPNTNTPFEEADRLVFGRVQKADYPVEIILTDTSRKDRSEDEIKDIASEEETVAYRIARLIKEENRSPGDIAILLRNANKASDPYVKALADKGIPSVVTGGARFESEREVVLLLNILRTADNHLCDIPLAAAMTSSAFGFSSSDLAEIRGGKDHLTLYRSVVEMSKGDSSLAAKCSKFLGTLSSLTFASRTMTSHEFLSYLFKKLDFFSLPEVRENPSGRQNIRFLYDISREYDQTGKEGLHGYLRLLESKIENDSLKKELVSGKNAVTITSIHKSKGLQFPVVFVSGLGKRFNKEDESGKILLERSLGFGFRIPDPTGFFLCSSIIRNCLARKTAYDGVSEEMRILYVALTRAQERLILTSVSTAGQKSSLSIDSLLENAAKSAAFPDSYTLLTDSNYMDIILRACCLKKPVFDLIRISGRKDLADATGTAAVFEGGKEENDRHETGEIKKNLDFVYPYSYLEKVPSKLAVSKLYPDILDENSVPGLSFDGLFVPKKEDVPDKMPLPRFISGDTRIDGAEKGTATHVFLQFADFSALEKGLVAEEADRLAKEGFITDKMASLVEKDQIETFARSGIFGKMLDSEELYRELRFNLNLPACDFTSDENLKEKLRSTDTTVTVQGVFDCIFRDTEGNFVIVDYKTDRMTEYEMLHPEEGKEKLLQRHSVQLRYYAKACREIFGKEPSEVLIYSLPLGDTAKVKI